MGKLCRIRLLRPDEIKKLDDGVSDLEFAVLTGQPEAAEVCGRVGKAVCQKKQKGKKK